VDSASIIYFVLNREGAKDAKFFCWFCSDQVKFMAKPFSLKEKFL